MDLIKWYLQMEVLLFALFFISALIFFIAGKDDFGRTENKLIIKDIEKGKDKDEEEEKIKPAVGVKKQA